MTPAECVLRSRALNVPVVETERLLLRGWLDEDLDPLAEMYADPEVMRFIGDGVVVDRAETADHIARMTAHWDAHGFGLWAAVDRASGELIGRIGLMMREDFDNEVEVGWVLARSRWGRGYAAEGGAAALRHGFTALGFARIISIAHADNSASHNVMRKLGMTFGGTRPSSFRPELQTVWYELSVEAWSTRLRA